MPRPPTGKKPPQKILIARLSAHGDVIQTLPLLAALKRGDPSLFVGWVVEASAAPLLENHPLIDRLHVFRQKPWLASLVRRPWTILETSGRRDFFRFIAELRQEAYDTSLDVQGLLKSALLPCLAGIPRRLGYHRTREGADIFYTETLPYHDLKDPAFPAAARFLGFAQHLGYLDGPPSRDLLARFPVPLPPVSPASRKKADALFSSLDPALPTLAIAPGTTWASKRWPMAHWRTLLETLGQWPVNRILLGGPEDASWTDRLLEPLSTAATVHNWVGRTALPDLYEILRRVDGFIGPDSAPLHIAGAVASNWEKPRIIGLYGPTAPGRTGPVGDKHRVATTALPCQPCFRKRCPLKSPLKTDACMNTLPPDRVIRLLQAQYEALTGSLPNGTLRKAGHQ